MLDYSVISVITRVLTGCALKVKEGFTSLSTVISRSMHVVGHYFVHFVAE